MQWLSSMSYRIGSYLKNPSLVIATKEMVACKSYLQLFPGTSIVRRTQTLQPAQLSHLSLRLHPALRCHHTKPGCFPGHPGTIRALRCFSLRNRQLLHQHSGKPTLHFTKVLPLSIQAPRSLCKYLVPAEQYQSHPSIENHGLVMILECIHTSQIYMMVNGILCSPHVANLFIPLCRRLSYILIHWRYRAIE